MLRICFYTALIFFSFLLVRLSTPYLAVEDGVAFLRIKRSVLNNSAWKTAFYIHVFSSSFLLLAGFTQFSGTILRKRKGVHRGVGMMYIVVILLLSGPAGLIMGLYANGGLSSRFSFVLLALLWLFFTSMAFRAILNKNWDQHGKFMIRSYALTLSAVTLRLWKYIIANYIIELPPMDLYRLVAWLGWVPNLFIAEWLIYKKQHVRWLFQKKDAEKK